ncbi:hypothetical protein [Nocardioides sp. CCNWLW212]|uniref:hypothetical protein n=1 Tax=Nocardioides sp. CCNWLW212 TaxID=3128897 RepID=UPI00307D91E2
MAAAVIAISLLLMGWVFVLGEAHVAWVDAIPGTGPAYAVGVLAVAQLPTLLLGTAHFARRGSVHDRTLPGWWQAAAALVASWHLTLLVATFDRKNGRMGEMRLTLDAERFDVAATTLRVSCVAFLLVAVVVAARREGRQAKARTSTNGSD